MERWPRISIVTPSFNEAASIIATVESVARQDYLDLEHIVIDGGSSDGTLERLGRFPHLKVVSEPRQGQVHAINEGFRVSTGDIMGLLNPDDALLPGALRRVAREIGPACGQHIVIGRCRFVDELDRFTGIEHPSWFESHHLVLEVWRGLAIPGPAVFWTREAWQACGPMDDGLTPAWVDYDLFCKFSRRYPFHPVNQVLATHRLRVEFGTEPGSDEHRLEEAIRLSRRHWGSPLSPTYWRLALSLALFRLNRQGRARSQLRRAEEGWRRRQPLPALGHALAGAILAPEVAFYTGVYPSLRDRAPRVCKQALRRLGKIRGPAAETAAYLKHTDVWSDGWVGPRLVVRRESGSDARAVSLKGWTDLRHLGRSLILTVRIDQQVAGRHRILQPGDFAVQIPLPGPLPPGSHTIEVEASTWFVPHRLLRNEDFRPLAWRIAAAEFETLDGTR